LAGLAFLWAFSARCFCGLRRIKGLCCTYRIEVTACETSSPDEAILKTTILQEKIFRLDKPIFKPAYITAGEITTKTPQILSFYIAGSCANFPVGFQASYYVENRPAQLRDKAVLLPIPENLKKY
jgi:hypothetical protein